MFATFSPNKLLDELFSRTPLRFCCRRKKNRFRPLTVMRLLFIRIFLLAIRKTRERIDDHHSSRMMAIYI